MKRILSITLAMVMVFGMFAGMPFNVKAAPGDAEQYVYSVWLDIVDGTGNGTTTFGWSQIAELNAKIASSYTNDWDIVIVTIKATTSPSSATTIVFPDDAKIIGNSARTYSNLGIEAKQDLIIEDLRINNTAALPDTALFLNPILTSLTSRLKVIGDCQIFTSGSGTKALRATKNVVIEAKNVFDPSAGVSGQEIDEKHPGTLHLKGAHSGIDMYSNERTTLYVHIPVTAESTDASDTTSGGVNLHSDTTTIRGDDSLTVIGARAAIRLECDTLRILNAVYASSSHPDSGALVLDSAYNNVTITGRPEGDTTGAVGVLSLIGDAANGNGVHMYQLTPTTITFQHLANLSITAAGSGSGIKFVGMDNKTVNFELPNATTIQGGATGHGLSLDLSGSGDLFVNNKGAQINFKGGATSGHGISPTNSLVIGGSTSGGATTIDAKGNGTGYGIYLTANNTLNLINQLNLIVEGGTSQPGMTISGNGKVNFAGAQVLTVKNNSAETEVIPCEGGTTPWDITGAGYISTGHDKTNYIVCSIPAAQNTTIKRTTGIPAITVESGELPYGTTTASYSYTLTADNAPTAWAVKTGSLPTGLTLSNSGVISGLPSAAGTYRFVLTATNATGTSAPIEYFIKIYSNPEIAITYTGLDNLTVDQPVTGSIIFTMVGGEYAPLVDINTAEFNVGNLPPGLTLGALVRTSDTVLTIPVTGAPTTYNGSTRSLTVPTIVDKSNAVYSTINIPVSGTVTASAVAKGAGAAVSAAPSWYGEAQIHSITVYELTALGMTGQDVEYAISLQSGLTGAALNGLDWALTRTWNSVRDGATYYDLYANKTYYIYARTRANTNYNTGVAQSAGITTATTKHEVIFVPTGKEPSGGYGSISAKVTGVGHLAVTPDAITPGDMIDEDRNIVFTAVPDYGYRIKQWKDNDEVVNGTNTTYTINRIDEDHYISIEFERITLAVLFNVVGGNGEIHASVDGIAIESGDLVFFGKEVIFGIAPAKGYILKEWKVDGGVISNSKNRYVVDALVDPITVTVEFKPLPGGGSGGGGGAATDPKSTISFDTDGGSAVASQTIISGNMASKPAKPTKEGFTFEGWYADSELTEEYDFFAKVTSNITIYAKWKEVEKPAPKPEWQNPFSDVNKSNWFYGDVEYAVENGMFGGTSDTTFDPNAPMTRAMFVTVLWRIEESPKSGASPFTDVPGNTWYSQAVTWAAEKEIVSGIGSGLFAPDTAITREQMAAILYNYQQVSGKIPSEVMADMGFADWGTVSDYAKEAVNALVMQGLLKGKDGNLFDPKGTATRAEVAAMMHRFLEALK